MCPAHCCDADRPAPIQPAALVHHRACLCADDSVCAAWNSSKLPIYEPGLYEVVKEPRDRGNLQFSTDIHAHVAEADIIFVRCASLL